MPTPRFDTYYRYSELSSLLHQYATEYPQLVQIESIGKSFEGRDVWLLTVTNMETGAANEKPALWVDGNIHATEVSPSMACLYLLHTLVGGYGKDGGRYALFGLSSLLYPPPASTPTARSGRSPTNPKSSARPPGLIPTMRSR